MRRRAGAASRAAPATDSRCDDQAGRLFDVNRFALSPADIRCQCESQMDFKTSRAEDATCDFGELVATDAQDSVCGVCCVSTNNLRPLISAAADGGILVENRNRPRFSVRAVSFHLAKEGEFIFDTASCEAPGQGRDTIMRGIRRVTWCYAGRAATEACAVARSGIGFCAAELECRDPADEMSPIVFDNFSCDCRCRTGHGPAGGCC